MNKKLLGFLLVPILFAIPNSAYSTPLFGSSIQLSADSFSTSPQIASDGTDVFAVWQNAASNISFIPIVGGVPGTEIELNPTDFGSSSPQIASDGTDMFAVWQNAASNISFIPIVGGVPGTEIVLNPTDFGSSRPQIASDGTDMFVVWQNAASNISFTRITSGDADEVAAFSLVAFTGDEMHEDSGAVGSVFDVGETVYKDNADGVVSAGDIRLANAATQGTFVDGSVVTSGDADEVAAFSLVAFTGDEMHEDSGAVGSVFDVGETVYKDNADGVVSAGDIRLANAATQGTFVDGSVVGVDPELVLSSDFGSSNPQIASDGTDVFAVWQNAASNISFIPIVGGVPGTEIELNPTDFGSSSPQIASDGTDMFAVWQNAASNISFIPIVGGVPGTETEVSSGGFASKPQLAVSGTNTYVTWEDSSLGNSEVFFKANANPPINLSGTSGNSFTPKVTASGSNVYVTWRDLTFSSGGLDVLFKASSDNGGSFGGLKKLNTGGNTNGQQIVATATSSNVVWSQTDSGNRDIFFATGPVSDIDVNFDSAEYLTSDTTVITVTDPNKIGDGSDSITVDLTSSILPGTITLTLTEDADTGVFSGPAILTTGPTVPGSAITVSPGDLLTATYTDGLVTQTAIALVFQRTVAFDSLAYDYSDHGHITVTDQNSNLDLGTAETIDVKITSIANPEGVHLFLTEDGPNSGVFGGTLPSQSDLIFSLDFNGEVPASSSLTITMLLPSPDTCPFCSPDPILTPDVDTKDVTVVSTSSTFPDGDIQLTLTETDATSAFFTGILILTPGDKVDGSAIHVEPGDIVSVTNDALTSNVLAVLNPVLSRNVIQVIPSDDAAVPDPITGDTITASYLGTSSTPVKVTNLFGPGGGGGGISRAGFVVNFLAGLGGGGPGNHPPSFGPSSFAIITGGEEGFGGILNDNNVNTLEQTKTFKVGERSEIRIDFTESGGIGKIEHIALYTNIRDGQKKYDSDAYITYDPLKSPQLTVHDPNGLFSEANFELLQKDTTNFVLKFDLTFAKPMAKSDLILESWNIKKWSSVNKIPNAIEVISSGILQEKQSEPVKTFLEDVTDDQVIPVWVKSNAKWWSDDKINNDNFISGIEYLVNEGIIKVSLPEGTDNSISEMPSWIKSTAGWWADDMISEDEFVTAIEWLISNNIIQVAA